MATEMATVTQTGPQEEQSFTNPYAADFGKPDDQQKVYLAGLVPTQRKDRNDCLAKIHGESMPVGIIHIIFTIMDGVKLICRKT